MAGGSGTRFWPKSRHLEPKQLCRIGSNNATMLVQTLDRLDNLIPPERRLIVTHQDQMELTRRQAEGRCDHFLAEPAAKNTAHALALAALEISRMAPGSGPGPIMISVHADALIKNPDAFNQAVKRMVQTAAMEKLTLLGITPQYPETGYGYIEKGEGLKPETPIFQVKSFREKPDQATAASYIKTGRFLWNSGIFAWRVDTILDELGNFLPQSLHSLRQLLEGYGVSSFNEVPQDELARTYNALPSIAIDNGVLEKSQRVAVVEADIGWKDVGSWDALDQCFPTDEKGNLFYGEVIAMDCEGITVDSDTKIVACIGVKDLVVVVSKGAVLVCPKSRAQDVKKVVEELKARSRTDLV
ncbi:mannose-1-phosphate guanylyltransferase [Oligoflexus tunisiensis]|uniref:mannose-1-phosphate guanylyltransferase n=1 Tax=Oligoflexus tunisiensis TaxID=708132 RepID=UPI001FDFFC7A|nr:sugar phosphate nucleotidyltransferase [Oligoflexus tunisiensis]